MVLFIYAFMWLGKQMVSSTPTADSIISSGFVARGPWLGFYFLDDRENAYSQGGYFVYALAWPGLKRSLLARAGKRAQ